jgi:hypothetical protein
VGAVSAEADPGYFYGYYPHAASHVEVARPYGSYGYGIHHLGKREAEAEAEPGYGYYGYYPYHAAYYLPTAVSHTAVSTPFASYGYSTHAIGKRSAEAEPGYFYGYGPGIALHPWGGSSYTYRSVQGIGKRSADAEPGYGYYGYPYYGYSASHVSSITPFAAYGYGIHHG